MPSILNSTGFTTTARPGVYTRIDASALAGGDIESGNVAIVGDFPKFQSQTPKQFFSRRALTSYDSTDSDLAVLAQLAFNPSNDPNANNGVSSISFVNGRDGAVQATAVQGPLTLKSKIYGLQGNRLQSVLSIDSSKYTLELNRNGLTEKFEVESGILAQITNSTSNNLSLVIDEGTLTLTDTVASSVLITITPSEAPSLKQAVELIDQLTDVSASLVEPSEILLTEIGYISESISASTTLDLESPAYLLLKALETSSLISATIDTSSTAGTLSAGTVQATGGAQGSTFDYDLALQAIESEDIQIVVLFSTDLAIQSKLQAHLSASANAGYERQAYTAIASTSTLEQVKTRASKLNHEGIALASQSIEIFNPKGNRQELDSRYTALMFSGMQAGSDIGEPLTRKRPAIIKTKEAWNTHNDVEQALRSGTIFISQDNLGPIIERSITTYLTDNNPIFSEISAYESIITSLRDLRNAVKDQIGRPVKSSQLALLEARVKTRLTAQVRDSIIKAFQGVQLEDLGDQIAISYQVAPLEPLNFVTITAVAQRII